MQGGHRVLTVQGIPRHGRRGTHHAGHQGWRFFPAHRRGDPAADLGGRAAVLPVPVPIRGQREDDDGVHRVGHRAGGYGQTEGGQVPLGGCAGCEGQRLWRQRRHPARQDAPGPPPARRGHRVRVRPRVVADRGPGVGEVQARDPAPGRVAGEEELPGEETQAPAERRGPRVEAPADGHRGGGRRGWCEGRAGRRSQGQRRGGVPARARGGRGRASAGANFQGCSRNHEPRGSTAPRRRRVRRRRAGGAHRVSPGRALAQQAGPGDDRRRVRGGGRRIRGGRGGRRHGRLIYFFIFSRMKFKRMYVRVPCTSCVVRVHHSSTSAGVSSIGVSSAPSASSKSSESSDESSASSEESSSSSSSKNSPSSSSSMDHSSSSSSSPPPPSSSSSCPYMR